MTAKQFLKNYRRVKNAWIPRQKRRVGPDGSRQPNSNEARFRRMALGGQGAYEPTHIRITRTTERVYTPDFLFTTDDLHVVYVEVKGAYRLQSEDRARLAWEIAAEKISDAVFVWAKWNRGAYDCEAWFDGGAKVRKGRVASPQDFNTLIERTDR